MRVLIGHLHRGGRIAEGAILTIPEDEARRLHALGAVELMGDHGVAPQEDPAPQPPAAPFSQEPERDAQGRVRINFASRETLMSVRGIGAQIADAILNYRRAVKTINDLDELVTIPAIGRRVLPRIREYLTCT